MRVTAKDYFLKGVSYSEGSVEVERYAAKGAPTFIRIDFRGETHADMTVEQFNKMVITVNNCLRSVNLSSGE